MRLVKQIIKQHTYVNIEDNTCVTVSLSRLEEGPVWVVECSDSDHDPDFFDSRACADRQFGLILDTELSSVYQLSSRID